MERPIPAFYCCYLLRSRVTHGALYIGSTPNPVRRLRQHNGETKGGAKRTSWAARRPWDMTCLVTGFPSKTAALQFEWAWQNTHLSRHILPEDLATNIASEKHLSHTYAQLYSPTTGQRRRKRRRGPRSLGDRLTDLHLLLRVKSFCRWPLGVRFYDHAVFREWEREAAKMRTSLRAGITIGKPDEDRTTPTIVDGVPVPQGIKTIDVGYEAQKALLEKSKTLLDPSTNPVCGHCQRKISSEDRLAVICPTEACQAVSHLTCLSRDFLRQTGNNDAVLPLEGVCSSCQSTIKWGEVMKEVSLRSRGEKEVADLFKKRRQTRAASKEPATDARRAGNPGTDALDQSQSEEDELPEFVDIDQVLDSNAEDESFTTLSSESDAAPTLTKLRRHVAAPSGLPSVIEESARKNTTAVK